MIDLQIRIEGHIFDLDLIVDGNILIRHGHLQYVESSGVCRRRWINISFVGLPNTVIK
jgi:hypothetical protein